MSSRDFGTARPGVSARRRTKDRRKPLGARLLPGGTVTFRSIGRVLHVLWLEVTGLLFLVLAAVGAGAAVREYHRHLSWHAGLGKVFLATAFALAFAYFGVSSFWRSRRKPPAIERNR